MLVKLQKPGKTFSVIAGIMGSRYWTEVQWRTPFPLGIIGPRFALIS
jgi:hypothetical protein